MEKTLVFSIALVFSFGTCITSAKKVSDLDVLSQTERTKYTPVDTTVNKESHFNGSELEAARADECKCKNGKCMRECDVRKTTPCDDQKKICVCNPEFAKKSDDECEYCDCGQGINCAFQRSVGSAWYRICNCPEGYFKHSYFSKCRPECSKERPCQNGGTCKSNNQCKCGFDLTGDLCEEIVKCRSMCENRLEVDCLYDRKYQIAYCSCKNSSLYYDEKANICKPCPCENGYCDYENNFYDRKLICHCNSGYAKFNGYCKKCDCGFGVDGECKFDSKGEKICKCFDGFYEREGRCLACGCNSWSDMKTSCEVIDNVKRCFCKEGFKDVLGHCEVSDINQCETNNTCHPSATCRYTFGNLECKCPDGYRGYNGITVEPGEVCEDIDECRELTNACWRWDNVKCVNLPGSYKCECLQGCEPSSYRVAPHRTTCIQTAANVGPAVIVAFTTLVLIAVSCWMHKRVKSRASRPY